MKLNIEIKLLSPLHLGAGSGDVTIDADIIHDDVGLPVFPARRLRGLLYESALEVVEMGELSGHEIVSRQTLAELFNRDGSGAVTLRIHDLTPTGGATMHDYLQYLIERYDSLQADDVLEELTSVRYQTAIDRETGTAADGSLRNIRVLDSDMIVGFSGEIELAGEERHLAALAIAAQNLHYAGGKRNRGLGHIACTIDGQKKIVREALKRAKNTALKSAKEVG